VKTKSVVGLDLSLRQTAMVYLPEEWAIPMTKQTHDWGLARWRTVGGALHHHSTAVEIVEHIADIAEQVCNFIDEHQPTAVFVEQYAFSRNGAYAHAIGELGGVVKHLLVKMLGYDVGVVIATSARKLTFGRVPRGTNAKKFVEARLALVDAPFAKGKPGEGERDAFVIANYGLTEVGLPAMIIVEQKENG
jgi:Holliday junction resolvasome RuvABC endonuclease subunit